MKIVHGRKGVAMQGDLFMESINDALRTVVQKLGGTKKIGAELRPEKMMDEASRWLSDCLNEDRREKLDPAQIMWLLTKSREAGIHDAINYICESAGYSHPEPIELEDEKDRIMREFVEATKQQRLNLERLEKLSKAMAGNVRLASGI